MASAKKLIFTEKADVAREISAFLEKKMGVKQKKNHRYIDVGDISIIWAKGHLMELAKVDAYFPDIIKTPENSGQNGLYWRAVPLPILPSSFITIPTNDADNLLQLNEIGRMMSISDEIYNASDSDREGQLIFDEIVRHFGIVKKTKRLVFSALDNASFEKAFSSVQPNELPAWKLAGVAASARAEADWLIGTNGTRAMTLYHSSRAKETFNIGRVMTPVISVVVKRQLEIDAFKSIEYYVPIITLPDGTEIEWQSTSINTDNVDAVLDSKIIDKKFAESIVNEINNGLAGQVIDLKSLEVSEPPPLPFSLSSLQSELSRRYGLSVKEISDACASLYRKKMQTYVGTDCQYLPSSMHCEAGKVLFGIKSLFGKSVRGANVNLKNGCWDDSKLTGAGAAAHHAIIPTGHSGMIASEAEKIVYDAVCNRYVAQFHPDSRSLSIGIKIDFGGNVFGAEEKAELCRGWKSVEKEPIKDSDEMRISGDSDDLDTSSSLQKDGRGSYAINKA